MAGLHGARRLSERNNDVTNLMMVASPRLQKSDLGSTRREIISRMDLNENSRPVYLQNLERQRLVNKNGTKECEVGMKQKDKLSGWNAVHTVIGRDGTVIESLDDSSRGQAHRARLKVDPSIKEDKSDDCSIFSKRRNDSTKRGGLQSGRGDQRVSRRSRIRIPQNIDGGFQAIQEAATGAVPGRKPYLPGNMNPSIRFKRDSYLASPKAFMHQASHQFATASVSHTAEKPATAGLTAASSIVPISCFQKSEGPVSHKNSMSGLSTVSKHDLKIQPSGLTQESSAEASRNISKEGLKGISKEKSQWEELKQPLTAKDLITPEQLGEFKAAAVGAPAADSPTIEHPDVPLPPLLQEKQPRITSNIVDTINETPSATSRTDWITLRDLSGVSSNLKRKPSEPKLFPTALSTAPAFNDPISGSFGPRSGTVLYSTAARPYLTAQNSVSNISSVNSCGPIESVKKFRAGPDRNIIGEHVHREHYLRLSKDAKASTPDGSPSSSLISPMSPPVQELCALSLSDDHISQVTRIEHTCNSSAASANNFPKTSKPAISHQYAGLDVPANRLSASELAKTHPKTVRTNSWGTAPYKKSQAIEDASNRRQGPTLPAFLTGAAASADPGAAARLQYGGASVLIQNVEPRYLNASPTGIDDSRVKPLSVAQTRRSDLERETDKFPDEAKNGPRLPAFLLGKTASIDSGAAARAQYGSNTQEEHEERFARMMRRTVPEQRVLDVPPKFKNADDTSPMTPALRSQGQVQEAAPLANRKDPFARAKRVRV